MSNGTFGSRASPVLGARMILPAAKVISAGGKQGSAFVVSDSSNGTYVLTCHHVIRDCIKQNDRWDPLEKSSKKVEQLLPCAVETFRYDPRGRHLQTVTTSAEVVAYRSYGDEWSFDGDMALLKLKVPLDLPKASVIAEEHFEDEATHRKALKVIEKSLKCFKGKRNSMELILN